LYLGWAGQRCRAKVVTVPVEWYDRGSWRMPPLYRLTKPVMSGRRKVGLLVLRGYLLVAFLLVLIKIVEAAIR
jgi:hypothetical protein